MRSFRPFVALALVMSAALTQQPNTPFATMTINGTDLGVYPIQQSVRRNTTATILFQGAGATSAHPLGQPFAMFQSATGQVQPGAMVVFGDIVHIPVSPMPFTILDPTTNPALHTDPATGIFTLPIFVPGTIPLNLNVAFQTAIFDPTSPAGVSLTAANRITIVAGPTVVNMTTGIGTYGDSYQATVNLQPFNMPLPFYGQNYTTVHISGDGFMTFGGGQAPDFTPSDYDLNAGPPRLAAFWCDLDQLGAEIVRYTIDNNPGPNVQPSLLVEFIGVEDAGSVGIYHTFSWMIDNTGFIDIYYSPANTASIYDTICGIGPGNSLSAVAMRDLSSLLTPNSYLGAINASLYEWFGTPGMPNYTPATFRPYDLYARHMNFLPHGAGSLPGSTNRYAIY